MNRDLSVSAFNPEFAFENRNLRLSTNENNTMLSWVNEKGTSEIGLSDIRYYNSGWNTTNTIEGIVIGIAILNHNLTLFTHSEGGTDRIYALHYNSTVHKDCLEGKMLYWGNLGFDLQHPIETTVSYEAETVQKVYWVDGKNQPRMINIAANDDIILKWNSDRNSTAFDFVRTLQLNETVHIKKMLGATGMFPAGVIQYAFTYYDKYGQESNIFYTSPLLYTSHSDRGGSPEDKVDNAFQIEVTGVDTNFDYVRIYSIMRTSVNGTPICKRVQDIEIAGLDGNRLTFIDTGTVGDTIDPTELLYKGGEEVTASTIEQKDNTIFLGDIEIKRKPIEELKDSISYTTPTSDYRIFYPNKNTDGAYPYSNQLTSLNAAKDSSVSCGGFKRGDKYRLGLQFQYKTGKWSEPIWCNDYTQNNTPDYSNGVVSIPIFKASLDSSAVSELANAGYKKVRPVCVFPSMQDRNILCQGVICPTMYTRNHRYSSTEPSYNSSNTRRNARRRIPSEGIIEEDGTADLYAQASWFFRSMLSSPTDVKVNENGTVSPSVYDNGQSEYSLSYTNREMDTRWGYKPYFNGDVIRGVEIQGDYYPENQFIADFEFVTFHSPDVEFDTQMMNTEFTQCGCKQVGHTTFKQTLSDIDIQTDTPTASASGAGFVHKSFVENGDYGIVSGLFYDDYLIDDTAEGFVPYNKEAVKNPFKWMVYAWNRSGSLNNDVPRNAGEGVRTSMLKKKIISNLRYTETSWQDYNLDFVGEIGLFDGNTETISKIGSKGRIYKGNVDTVLIPDRTDGMYFAFNHDANREGEVITYEIPNSYLMRRFMGAELIVYTTGEDATAISNFTKDNVITKFNISNKWMKTFSPDVFEDDSNPKEIKKIESEGLYFYIGKDDEGPLEKGWYGVIGPEPGDDVEELRMTKSPVKMKYKSTSHLVIDNIDANWIVSDTRTLPIIEITQDTGSMAFGGRSLDAQKANDWLPCGEPKGFSKNANNTWNSCEVKWEYGDTYYQRWDCLKTYAFTEEDENQVVEIGSFMLETRTNIDGRYDRNRGQSNNLYMSPRNFNLINPVYSQLNNFFTYKILDKSFYENNTFPNQVTWSLTKQSSADVDMWTNVTLANTIEMDGDKGKVNKLIRMNDQLLCFQDTGFSQVMYNENMALTTTEGVPIEIANSGKVQGKRYLSNTVGCSNKWSIVPTPSGIYFMDSHNKSIYMFNGQLNNLSTAAGFNTWCKGNINLTKDGWNPEGFGDFVGYYDKLNQDVLFINSSIALAYSEKIGAFTSFYDYGGASFFCNLDDTGLWIKDYTEPGTTVTNSKIWLHQGGEYCNFFGEQKPYGMLLVGNPEPLTDKIFTNLEFRACVDGEGETEESRYKPFLPFDYLETWNEYQHGVAELQWKNGDKLKETMRHHLLDNTAHLARKFRIWRCDIPRDNAETVNVFDYTFDDTFHNTRVGARIDRMRNPWLYIKLKKDSDTDKRVEIHDMVMTYYN